MTAIPTRRVVAAGPAVKNDDVDLAGGMSLERFEERAPAAALPAVHHLDHPVTGAGAVCIARFARLEADVSSADLSGVGRVSGVRFGRLGGVVHGRIAPGSPAARSLEVGAERTVSAGYQAVLATCQIADVPVRFVDADELWSEFLPASFRIPRTVVATAWEVCRLDDFWVALLVDLGLTSDANRFAKGYLSPLSRSIRGLSTIGVVLALAERGGHYHRLVAGGRRIRGPRGPVRTVRAASPKALDDAETRDSAPMVLVEVATPMRSTPRRSTSTRSTPRRSTPRRVSRPPAR